MYIFWIKGQGLCTKNIYAVQAFIRNITKYVFEVVDHEIL